VKVGPTEFGGQWINIDFGSDHFAILCTLSLINRVFFQIQFPVCRKSIRFFSTKEKDDECGGGSMAALFNAKEVSI
jgi:hypothetical protein